MAAPLSAWRLSRLGLPDSFWLSLVTASSRRRGGQTPRGANGFPTGLSVIRVVAGWEAMEVGMSVVLGLRVFWILAALLCAIGFLPLGAAREFVLNIGHRGKLKLATTVNNLPRFTVPQRWFTHFYPLGLLVNTILLTVTFLFAYACTFSIQEQESQVSALVSVLGGASTTDASGGIGKVEHLARYRGRAWGSLILLAMMEAQILRRIFENTHVFHFSPLARMHVLGYFVGMGYYPAASFTLFSQHLQDRDYMSLLSKFVVQRLGGAWVLHTGQPLLNSQIKLEDCARSLRSLKVFQWIGLAVFLLGWIQQYRTHSILATLRSKEVPTGVEAVLKPFLVDKRKADRYEIPRGSWFEWVSCAHYLAEIVLYAGIVIASGGNNINIWLLFLWVILNLSLSARDTHQWYKTKFEDYPPLRRAIIPFIY